MKVTLKILLAAAVVLLVYMCYKSVTGPIEYDDQKTIRDNAIIARLIEIRKAQIEYKNMYKTHAGSFDDLEKFLNTDKLPFLIKEGVLTDEQLEKACRACGIYHFIETLPDGFDTVLGENITISAGQKQLFTIARAMVQNSPMLILDEATSSVDTRTELITQEAMDKLTEHRTSFVIAHRLSTIKNANLILVMKDGDIIEQGDHETLLAKGGFYADLYNSQFDKAS